MLEQELKLTAPDLTELERVLASDLVARHAKTGQSISSLHYHGRYYDTDSNQLRAAGMSLRARREGLSWRATLKLKGQMIGGLSQRQEFEADISGWLESAAQLPEGGIKQKLLEVIKDDDILHKRVEVHMQRRIVIIDYQGSWIELVTDHGHISAGGGNQQLCEVECELIDGDLTAVIDFGSRLRAQFNLTPSLLSKHAIGISLLDRTPA